MEHVHYVYNIYTIKKYKKKKELAVRLIYTHIPAQIKTVCHVKTVDGGLNIYKHKEKEAEKDI